MALCCHVNFQPRRLVCLLLAVFAWAAVAGAQNRRQPAAPAPTPTPTNNLAYMPDGGFVTEWLISTPFPTDVDAGAYENFQRFNLERLPARDWLAPFGGAALVKPQAGVVTTAGRAAQTSAPAAAASTPRPRADVPETGAASAASAPNNGPVALAWKPFRAGEARLAFPQILAANAPGTAYAAAYLTADEANIWLLETDGWLGEIYLNGEKIYDGFALQPQRTMLARLREGPNLLLLRADGVQGDPWRRDWGWAATLRFWRARAVGPNLLAGALRPLNAWANAGTGVAEAVGLTLVNVSKQPAGEVAVTVKTDAGEQVVKAPNLSAGELREAEILLPFKETARRRAQVVAQAGPHRAEWEALWDAGKPPDDGVIYYLEGFHVDPVYLHDQRGYARITLSNTNQYVNSLRADPHYGVYLSEIDYLKPYLDTHPEDLPLVRQAVRDGRVGTGGTYNQFNELNIGGEAIVRNILYGRGYHENVLGDKPRALPLWDVFGHAPQITQIARKAGFEGVVWSKKITGFPSFFYDYALDGSRLLHRRVDYAYSFSGFGSGKNYSFDAFRRLTERKFAESRSLGSAVDLRINAADFTPPWTNLAGRVERLAQNRPQIKVTGQAQRLYFEELNREIAARKVAPPVSSRDKVFFHMGVAMARSDLKVGQRLTENATLNAERFATLAWLRGAQYPDLALDKAWRQILFNSHHDAITGTPSDNALLDLLHGYREAYELSRDALDDALKFIAAQVNTRPPPELAARNMAQIIVFNPLAWERTDAVRARVAFPAPVSAYEVRDAAGAVVPHSAASEKRDASGQIVAAEISFTARGAPSLGYATFHVQAAETFQSQQLSATPTIENEFYRVAVDPQRGGAVVSLFDKAANREVIRPGGPNLGNEIAALTEELTKKNVIYPAWEFWTTGERRFSTAAPAQVSSESSGDARRLVIIGQMPGGPRFRQFIELHEGVRRVDFRTELLDYRGRDELFAVNFPLNLKGGALVTEDRFGSVVRNSSKGFLDFRSNTDKLTSGALVYPAYNWAEYGSSLTLKFANAQGQAVANIPLRPLALVRGRGALADELTEKLVAAFIRQGVSATPFYDDNDAARRAALSIEDNTLPRRLNDDAGYHSFRVALGGPAENPYAQKLCQANARPCREWSQRISREGYGYLFLYDKDVAEGWPAMPVLLIAGRDEQQSRRAVEQLLAPLSTAGNRALTLSADALADPQATAAQSFASDYGVALINGGAPATSLERPDTLTLLLTHTALWPGVNLAWEFTPEHKSHVFTYALYPHAGDWRAAGTVRAGYEFNNPLIARQTDVHAGPLPARHSFVHVSDENVVLSALKPGGNPQANFRRVPRPVIARFYECEGLKTTANVTFAPHPNAPAVRDAVWTALPADLLEKPLAGQPGAAWPYGSDQPFQLSLDGFGIETVEMKLLNAEPEHRAEIGAQAEPVQPVFARYWAHNAGAAPLGNDPVKVTVRNVEQMGALAGFAYDDPYNQGGTTTLALRVAVVNNYQDRRAKGAVSLEVAPGWRVVPERFEYDLEAGGGAVRDVIVTGFPVKKGEAWERASGLVKARTEHAGQIYQDVLEIGAPLLLEWRVERQGGEFYARVRNPHRQRIEGGVSFIAPPELWATDVALPPREQGFSLGPGEDALLRLADDKTLNGAWAVARLSYNGHVFYLRADGRPAEPVKR